MKYIIVNSVKDGNRYFRKVNKQKKNTTANLKCVHLVDFAKEVVIKHMAKKGIIKALDVLDSTSGAVLLEEILNEVAGVNYFVPRESLSQDTAQEIWNVLMQLRMGVTTDAYAQSEDTKVLQIRTLIESYEKALKDRGQYDVPSLYKAALMIMKEESIRGRVSDEYIISDVCHKSLTAVEQQFLQQYTCRTYSQFSLLTELEEKSVNSIKGAAFFRAYGISNEISHVISGILQKGQNLGEVEIFYTSAEYEPFLEGQFSARGIPYVMANRQLPADNTYLHAMKYILSWAKEDFSYQALKPVMSLSYDYKNTYFSEIRAGIGWSAKRYHAYIQGVRNQAHKEDEEYIKRQKKRLAYCDCLEELLAIFEWKEGSSVSYESVFWRLISAVRNLLGKKEEYKYVTAGLKDTARRLKHLGGSTKLEEVISVLETEIKELTYDDEESACAVAIRKLDANIHILDRKHIYVLGMSNAHFAGSATESPVLSDEELETYLDVQKGYVSLRKDQDEKKKQALFMTLSTREETGTLEIGYPCFDTINLRSMSPAIPYIRMMQDARITESAIAYAGYENIVANNIIYREASVWQQKKSEEVQEEETAEIISPIDCWSTTSLQQLLACPLQFYYQRVLRLPDENYKMPQSDRWLPASEKGTLAHAIMEDYCNEVFLNKTSAEISVEIKEHLLEEIMDTRIQEMLTLCPYMSKASYEIECEVVRRNCRSYLEKMHKEFSSPDNKWTVVACEAEFNDVILPFNHGEDFVNLKFQGKIDRLDAYVDEENVNHYRIVDYKSGGQRRHQEEIDKHKNIQHVVYKLAIEAMKKDEENVMVDQVVFLHFFEEDAQKQEIVLSDHMIAGFPGDVEEFVVQVLKNQMYEKHDEDNCKYCTYADICMANVRGEKL